MLRFTVIHYILCLRDGFYVRFTGIHLCLRDGFYVRFTGIHWCLRDAFYVRFIGIHLFEGCILC